jgi:hypothetical protein
VAEKKAARRIFRHLLVGCDRLRSVRVGELVNIGQSASRALEAFHHVRVAAVRRLQVRRRLADSQQIASRRLAFATSRKYSELPEVHADRPTPVHMSGGAA